MHTQYLSSNWADVLVAQLKIINKNKHKKNNSLEHSANLSSM